MKVIKNGIKEKDIVITVGFTEQDISKLIESGIGYTAQMAHSADCQWCVRCSYCVKCHETC